MFWRAGHPAYVLEEVVEAGGTAGDHVFGHRDPLGQDTQLFRIAARDTTSRDRRAVLLDDRL